MEKKEKLNPLENVQPPNVIFLVIDALRPKNLSMFNYSKETDKNLKKIARKSLFFRNFFTQAPVITDNTLAYLEAKVTQEVDVGTHTIFVGELVEADVIKEGEPMTTEQKSHENSEP